MLVVNRFSSGIKDGVQQIIGKTIAGVIVKKSEDLPRSMVILLFTDNTNYEFYTGSSCSLDLTTIKGVAGVDRGGLEASRRYCNKTHSIIFEAFDPELILEK